MNHSIEVNGQTFFTAQVVDAYKRKTYDITLILHDPGDDYPLQLVDYYYGEPNLPTTRYYVELFMEVNK